MKILIAVTGASGFPLATRLLGTLGKLKVERHLVVSKNAQKVREYETKLSEADVKKLCEHYYEPDAIYTSICSGSFDIDAMVVIPCSMNTLGQIANGIEDNAITRAAGVNLKMERPVVLVPRDTPLNLAHLRNLTKAKEIGCSIVPPMLCHYINPKSVEDLDNYVVGRVLEVLKIKHGLYEKWVKE
jgi:4-hydroxy-3-polyprenylbenzoate decarboxylase